MLIARSIIRAVAKGIMAFLHSPGPHRIIQVGTGLPL